MIFVVLQWLGTLLSLAGAALVAYNRLTPGFTLFLVADALLSAVAIDAKLWGLLVLYVAYGAINAIGLRRQRNRKLYQHRLA